MHDVEKGIISDFNIPKSFRAHQPIDDPRKIIQAAIQDRSSQATEEMFSLATGKPPGNLQK